MGKASETLEFPLCSSILVGQVRQCAARSWLGLRHRRTMARTQTLSHARKCPSIWFGGRAVRRMLCNGWKFAGRSRVFRTRELASMPCRVYLTYRRADGAEFARPIQGGAHESVVDVCCLRCVD